MMIIIIIAMMSMIKSRICRAASSIETLGS